MKLALSILMMIQGYAVLANDLSTTPIHQLFKNGYMVTATIKNKEGIHFAVNTAMTKLENKTKEANNCYLHLKDTAKTSLNLKVNKEISFYQIKEVHKKFGPKDQFLYLQFMTSDKNQFIGGVRVGRKNSHKFSWFDSTFEKSIKDLNTLCTGLVFKVAPNSYLKTAGK